MANLSGKDIPVMDMSMAIAIGGPPLPDDDSSFVIITEFNRTVQGFLVGGVDRIVNMFWKDINPPPEGTQSGSYLTVITEVDGGYVLIIDVEKILSEVSGSSQRMTKENIDKKLEQKGHVLVVDDFVVARSQVKSVLEDLGLSYTEAVDGKDGLNIIKARVKEGIDVPSYLTMVISDVEMPRMDGYTLTTEVRKILELEGLYIMLHTSLSGVFNESMVEKVGAENLWQNISQMH